MIHGNTQGVREALLNEMDKLYDMQFDRSLFLPERLLGMLVNYTQQLNREIMGWMKYEEYRIGMEDIQIQEARFIPKRKLKTVLAWLLPANRKRAVYGQGAGWDKIRMFRTREYCIVDETTGKGIILRKSYRKWFRIMGQAAGTAVRILMRYGKVSREWKTRIPEMSAKQFWERYLMVGKR